MGRSGAPPDWHDSPPWRPRPVQSEAPLAERLLSGDKRALARGITLVENDDPAGWELVREVYPHTGKARIVGFTGPPGVGKSTLIGALVAHARAKEREVGVLSIDPSSPFTEGALLGDRIRLAEHFLDEGVYIRSMASRGALGGLSEATLQAVLLMDASGKEDVLVETVGVGQAEIDIIDHADTIVLALMPGSGDSVQALKAGVMEIPDVIVVNKANHPLTDTHGARDPRRAGARAGDRLEGPDRQDRGDRGERGGGACRGDRRPPRAHQRGRARSRSAAGATCATRCSGLAAVRLRRELERSLRGDASVQELLDRVVRREVDPASAAEELLRGRDARLARASYSMRRSMRVSRGMRPERQHHCGEDPAEDHHGLRAGRLGERPGDQKPDRKQDERAHPVVGAHPRERMRRDALGHRGVPQDVEEREPDARARTTATSTTATGAAAPNTTSRAGHGASTSNAARIGMSRSPAQAGERARHRAGAEQGGHDPEQRRGVVAVLGDGRPEDEQRRISRAAPQARRRRP